MRQTDVEIGRVTPGRIAQALESVLILDAPAPEKTVETWRGGAVISHETGNGAYLPWAQETFQDAYALGIRDGWMLTIETGGDETETHKINLWALCERDLQGYDPQEQDEQEAMADVIAEAAAEEIYNRLKPVQEEWDFLAANDLYKTAAGHYQTIQGIGL